MINHQKRVPCLFTSIPPDPKTHKPPQLLAKGWVSLTEEEKTGRMVALKAQARKLKREAYALYFAYRDPRLPWYLRLFALFVVARTFSPIDLIPDFIPVLGYLDDLILVPFYITLAVRWIPAPILADARARADQTIRGEKPGRWYYAIPAVLIWLVLLAVLGKVIYSLVQN